MEEGGAANEDQVPKDQANENQAPKGQVEWTPSERKPSGMWAKCKRKPSDIECQVDWRPSDIELQVESYYVLTMFRLCLDYYKTIMFRLI